MKILFLSDDFPPKDFGGAGIITADLALGMRKLGHEMYVITTIQDKKQTQGRRNWHGIMVYDLYVDYFQKLSTYISIFNPKAFRAVNKLIKEIRPDVIHAHNIHNYLSYHCLKISRKYTNKVFLTTHDAMSFNYGKLIDFYDKKDLSVQRNFHYKIGFWQNIKTAKKRYNPFRNILIRYYINSFCKKVFSISDRLKMALSQNNINNVETIYYGIDYRRWEVTDNERIKFAEKMNLVGSKIILFGGRLSEAKGGRIMIEVLKMLIEKDDKIKLLIVGSSNGYSDYLMDFAKRLQIRNNIIFTGWISREEMKKAYSICDVCVTPSIYFDAFNLFNIEAGAAKKPVVGTCFGGTPEIVIDGVTGLIVNPNNREMFRDALMKIIENKEFASKLGRAGYERIKDNFSIERFVNQTLMKYEN